MPSRANPFKKFLDNLRSKKNQNTAMDLDNFDIPTGEPIFSEKQDQPGKEGPKEYSPAPDAPSTDPQKPVHVTKKGENLAYIAEITGMTIGQLLESNPQLLEMRFSKGTELKLPPQENPNTNSLS